MVRLTVLPRATGTGDFHAASSNAPAITIGVSTPRAEEFRIEREHESPRNCRGPYPLPPRGKSLGLMNIISAGVTQLDLRSPDTRDAALRVPTQVIASESGNAFDWGDFGLGFAASSGVLLLVLLGAGVLAVRGHRGGHITST